MKFPTNPIACFALGLVAVYLCVLMILKISDSAMVKKLLSSLGMKEGFAGERQYANKECTFSDWTPNSESEGEECEIGDSSCGHFGTKTCESRWVASEEGDLKSASKTERRQNPAPFAGPTDVVGASN